MLQADSFLIVMMWQCIFEKEDWKNFDHLQFGQFLIFTVVLLNITTQSVNSNVLIIPRSIYYERKLLCLLKLEIKHRNSNLSIRTAKNGRSVSSWERKLSSRSFRELSPASA